MEIASILEKLIHVFTGRQPGDVISTNEKRNIQFGQSRKAVISKIQPGDPNLGKLDLSSNDFAAVTAVILPIKAQESSTKFAGDILITRANISLKINNKPGLFSKMYCQLWQADSLKRRGSNRELARSKIH